MENSENFAKFCNQIVSDYKNGKLSLIDAGKKICGKNRWDSFEGLLHPMLNKVANLAFDISEEFRSDEEDLVDWKIIEKTLKNYLNGDWEPTCWILAAIYGEYHGGKLVHTFGVSVQRQNGQNVIETASKEISTTIDRVAKTVNIKQTDERYLQNLARLIPEAIAKYNRVNVSVREYLTEPYYSTA